MPVEMRVWTCKYPADSDLNERLRETAKQANLPYYKLLTRMLDLWDKYQAENSFQSEGFNARITRIEKFIERLKVTGELQWEWDSKTENWIEPDKQPIKDEPEAGKQSTEDQPVIEPAKQDEIKPKPKSNKKQTRTK